MRCALAAAALLAAFATPALAGGAPITVPTDPAAPVTTFLLAGPADFQDLKIDATAGQDIFVAMATLDNEHAQVFDPSGKPLAAFDGFEGSQGPEDRGAELHPLTSGTYTVRVAPTVKADPTRFPVDVEIWAWPDCRGGPATGCTVAPGHTRHGTFGAANDADCFRIVGPAGRYAATLDFTGTYIAVFEVLDARGRHLATTGLGPRRPSHLGFEFRLPASGGPYFLKATATDANHAGRGTYAMGLTRG